jgi:hypothetical protein
MNVGDKLICINQINNGWGWQLFDEGKEYQILYVDYDEFGKIITVTLNHTLYGSEFFEHKLDFVKKNFRTKGELREDKLNELGI